MCSVKLSIGIEEMTSHTKTEGKCHQGACLAMHVKSSFSVEKKNDKVRNSGLHKEKRTSKEGIH